MNRASFTKLLKPFELLLLAQSLRRLRVSVNEKNIPYLEVPYHSMRLVMLYRVFSLLLSINGVFLHEMDAIQSKFS